MPWWRKKAEEYQLSFIVEAILVAARVCQRQESVRRDGSEGGSEGEAWTARSRVEAGGIGMLGQRQVTPRWEDDPVRRHVGGEGVRGRGGLSKKVLKN